MAEKNENGGALLEVMLALVLLLLLIMMINRSVADYHLMILEVERRSEERVSRLNLYERDKSAYELMSGSN
ncbi:hypothetical protein [Ignatzschineria sp. LJL83]